MMEDTNIADGIAVKLLLAGIVLAGGAVGALGLTPGATQADASGVDDGLVDDRSHRFAFPIDNVTALSHSRRTSVSPAVGQDMDPYALGQDMDPYALGQDMDPY